MSSSFGDDGGLFCGSAADGRKRHKIIAQMCLTIWRIT
jgi:hypothetical protein